MIWAYAAMAAVSLFESWEKSQSANLTVTAIKAKEEGAKLQAAQQALNNTRKINQLRSFQASQEAFSGFKSGSPTFLAIDREDIKRLHESNEIVKENEMLKILGFNVEATKYKTKSIIDLLGGGLEAGIDIWKGFGHGN